MGSSRKIRVSGQRRGCIRGKKKYVGSTRLSSGTLCGKSKFRSSYSGSGLPSSAPFRLRGPWFPTRGREYECRSVRGKKRGMNFRGKKEAHVMSLMPALRSDSPCKNVTQSVLLPETTRCPEGRTLKCTDFSETTPPPSPKTRKESFVTFSVGDGSLVLESLATRVPSETLFGEDTRRTVGTSRTWSRCTPVPGAGPSTYILVDSEQVCRGTRTRVQGIDILLSQSPFTRFEGKLKFYKKDPGRCLVRV